MLSEISVSGGSLSSCDEIVDLMRRCRVVGDVTSNRSVTLNGVEPGCRVLITSQLSEIQLKQFWMRLQNEFDFECGHYSIKFSKSGCTSDLCRQSLCRFTT